MKLYELKAGDVVCVDRTYYQSQEGVLIYINGSLGLFCPFSELESQLYAPTWVTDSEITKKIGYINLSDLIVDCWKSE